MSDTVIYNGVNYDVEKVILMKGAKALIDISKQTNVQNAFSSDKIKYPIVIPVGDDFYTLIKPAVEAKNPSVAFVLSKFTLKKLRDEPVVVSRLRNPVLPTLLVTTPQRRNDPSEEYVVNRFKEHDRIKPLVEITERKPYPVNAPKLTGIEVLRERARVQQLEYQNRNQFDDRQNNHNRNPC